MGVYTHFPDEQMEVSIVTFRFSQLVSVVEVGLSPESFKSENRGP